MRSLLNIFLINFCHLSLLAFIYYNLKPLTTYTYSINLISPFGNINDIYTKSSAETLPNGKHDFRILSVSFSILY